MNYRISKSCWLGACSVLLSSSLWAADWPAYNGPLGNRTTPEKILLQWPAAGLKQVWKVETPRGFSSFTVAEGKAFIQITRTLNGAPREVCVAFDANTGKELWVADVGPAKYESGGDDGTPTNKGGDGPRSTPTISASKVYVYTPAMVLYCFDAATGKQIWTKDVMREHKGRKIGWASATSPVVDGDLVFVGGGGAGESLLGINKTTGEVVWKAHNETTTHATPIVGTILGKRQVIFFLQSGLLSVDPGTGAELWRFPFRFAVSTAASPVIADDIVYCSAGYDVGAAACKISKAGDQFTATLLWKTKGNKPVANHWSTPVYKDGHLYGMFSFKDYGKGPMKCVEVATGKVKWEQPGFGAGQVILVDNNVLALADDGRLVVVDPNPTAYKEIARFKAIDGKCWSTPTVSNGRIYARSTKEGVCLDVSLQARADK